MVKVALIKCPDYDPQEVSGSVKKAVDSPETDFLICMGVMTSHEISSYKQINKPVIASSVIDVNLQKIASLDNKSGIKNLGLYAILNKS